MALRNAPKVVIDTALDAANLIGDGLYGVDLKQVGSQVFVIEINDNPNIDAGNEDRIDKAQLYERIMKVFLDRIEKKKSAVARDARTAAVNGTALRLATRA
jgi:glutathione synthase/RimK-type ligase-like ATP-grasp enzyme